MTVEERLEALERRVAELENPTLPFGPFLPSMPKFPPWDGKCYFCGGNHGGLPCPSITPMSSENGSLER